jgi:hypothetical protein
MTTPELRDTHEPTDDELLEAFAQHYLVPEEDPFFERESVIAGLRAVAALRRSGDPGSDERTLAALNAFDPSSSTDSLSDYGAEHVQDMRVALRAAAAVNE